MQMTPRSGTPKPHVTRRRSVAPIPSSSTGALCALIRSGPTSWRLSRDCMARPRRSPGSRKALLPTFSHLASHLPRLIQPRRELGFRRQTVQAMKHGAPMIRMRGIPILMARMRGIPIPMARIRDTLTGMPRHLLGFLSTPPQAVIFRP